MQQATHLRGLARIGILALLALLLALPALGNDETPERGKARTEAGDSAEAIEGPAAITETLPAAQQSRGILELQQLAPVDAFDRGSSFTDAGLGREGGLNAIERGKLDMARAAVALAEEAGTRFFYPAGPVLPPRPEDIEAMKLELLRQQQPAAPTGDTGPDGVGDGLAPVQLIGPSAPTAAELEKLDHIWPSDSNPNAPVKPAAAEPAAPAKAEAEQAEVQR